MPGAALLLASLMAIASCSGASVQEAAPREDESPAWALEEGFLALALNEQGSLEPFAATEKAQSAPEPLPFALQRAVATLDSHDGRLYVALNRIGIDTLSLSSSDGRTVVRRETAYGADTGSASGDSTGTGDIFSSRSAGSFLRLDGELSLFLYRHPFFESVQEEGPGHAFVKAGPGGIGPSIQATAPYSLPEGITGDIFALYPDRKSVV